MAAADTAKDALMVSCRPSRLAQRINGVTGKQLQPVRLCFYPASLSVMPLHPSHPSQEAHP